MGPHVRSTPNDAAVIDLRQRSPQRRLLDLLHATTAISDEPHGLDDALDQAVEALCGHLDRDRGAAHVFEDGTLVCRATWQRRGGETVPTDPSTLRRPADERAVVWDDGGEGAGWTGIPVRVGRTVRMCSA